MFFTGIVLATLVAYGSSIGFALEHGGWSWLTPGLLTIGLLVVVLGEATDTWYQGLTNNSGRPYRLPWHKRWAGWKLGHIEDPFGPHAGVIENTYYYDPYSRRLYEIHGWDPARLEAKANIARYKAEGRPGWSR